MKKKIFLKIGFLSWIIPLMGGLIIFFAWVISRNYFGFNLHIMAETGLYWILFSVPFSLFGIVLLILFIIKNKRQFLTKPIVYIILILINIPVSYSILQRVETIRNRAYLKIYNLTNQDNVDFSFYGSYFHKDLDKINNNSYKVVYFKPEISNLSNNIDGIVDSFFLDIKYNNDFKKVLCPAIYQGNFMTLELNDNFKLIQK